MAFNVLLESCHRRELTAVRTWYKESLDTSVRLMSLGLTGDVEAAWTGELVVLDEVLETMT